MVQGLYNCIETKAGEGRTWIEDIDVRSTGIVREKAVLAPAALSICESVNGTRVDLQETRPFCPFVFTSSLSICAAAFFMQRGNAFHQKGTGPKL